MDPNNPFNPHNPNTPYNQQQYQPSASGPHYPVGDDVSGFARLSYGVLLTQALVVFFSWLHGASLF